MLWLVPDQPEFTGMINSEILICFKNMDFLKTEPPFGLFIIDFDSRTCDSYVRAREHIFAWTKVPHNKNAPVPLCWPHWVSSCNVTGMPGSWCFFLVPICGLLCFGEGRRGWIQKVGHSNPNSESICLAMDFLAIKEMDLKINSWACALGPEQGPLTLAFLKDDVSLIPQWYGLSLVPPSQWKSTSVPGKEGWRTWVIYF